MPRKIEVELVADPTGLERGFRRAERAGADFKRNIDSTKRTVLSTNRAFAGFLGGASAAAFFKSSIDAASDFNEQLSKTTAVFEDNSKEVEAWSETTTQAFGISRRAALATASSFGALFAPMGIVGKRAAEQSERLTELGADLASFYNTDV